MYNAVDFLGAGWYTYCGFMPSISPFGGNMRNLYENNPVNAVRLNTDLHFADYENEYSYRDFMDGFFRFVEEFQLLRPDLWARFVQQFREEDADYESGWRGEYWGKMMRGACFVYSYTKNPELLTLLRETVKDMMSTAEEDGRISSYGRNHEFDAWDLWARKYVLLGMQYYLEIDPECENRAEIIECMCRQADCIMAKIGPKQEGKKPITSATRHWRGLNSSSLLEPIVRLYSLSGEKKYLDFAGYIVNNGGFDVENLFELAYKDELAPYQYPVTKAYEMTSCFEGLIEYYRIVGTEWYLDAAVNFANRILAHDFTVIGCAGCTHELFDHSTVRQANTTNGIIMQETCVTVTLMKFFYQLHLLTGDPKYVDAFEISLYNAYLGSINTEKVIEPGIKANHSDWAIEPLPFDSYSPLTAGTRGNGIGGLKLMSDNHYYGCCACIGAAGIGLAPKLQLLAKEGGIVLNLYFNGEIVTKTPSGKPLTLKLDTEYPKMGEVKVTVECEEEGFELALRIPEWSENTSLTVCGKDVEVDEGYTVIDRVWKSGDSLTLTLDMTAQAILPIPYGTQILMNKVVWGINYMVPTFDREDPIAHRHIAIRRGPIMMAQENRLGYSVDEPIDVLVNPDGTVDLTFPKSDIAPYPHIVEMELPLTNGESIRVTDYASAGKLWCEKSKMAVWMLTE